MEQLYTPINKMNIRQTFLSLTDRTYPHGTEHKLFDKIPQNLDMDDFGNLFIKIGESDVMFTSHLDTATQALTSVTHVFDNGCVRTDGSTILGADDKAGVTIMMNMIENKIPGLYYFFLGEEVGCIGSKKVSEVHALEKLPYINKVISFDRRGTNSIITFQSGSRCCSDTFGKELALRFNNVESSFKYTTDPTGIYTDSAQFVKIYPECTNISVGYYNEHTFSERQDLDHLEKLSKACCEIDWSTLPVERDPSKSEYSSYGYYGYGYGWGGGAWGDEDEGYSYRATRIVNNTQKVLFHDEEFNYVSSFEFDKKTGEVTKVDLSSDRLAYEEGIIYDLLNNIELEYDTMHWDGKILKVTYLGGKSPTEATRKELIQYLDDLDLSSYYEEGPAMIHLGIH